MMNTNTLRQFALRLIGAGCLVCATSVSVQAAQLGPYVGGSFGVTEKQDDGSEYDLFILGDFFPVLSFTPVSHVSEVDTRDEGYMGLVGYRIHRHFALEAIFAHMGSVSYQALSDGTADVSIEEGSDETSPLTLRTRGQSSLSGIGMSALGIWPINPRWEVYGRAGVQFSTIRTDIRIVRVAGIDWVSGAEASFARKSSLDVVGGVGVAMSMFEIYGARLEYTRVIDAGDDVLAKGDADMLSLGFIVAF